MCAQAVDPSGRGDAAGAAALPLAKKTKSEKRKSKRKSKSNQVIPLTTLPHDRAEFLKVFFLTVKPITLQGEIIIQILQGPCLGV